METKKIKQLKDEFNGLLNDDQKFNYNKNEFADWLEDHDLCKHRWIKRKYKNPITKKLIAKWEFCKKCKSERKREVFKK